MSADDTVKFTKKTIKLPDSYNELNSSIADLIRQDERIITKYIERTIFTSTISESTKLELQSIFKNIRSGYVNSGKDL